MRDNAITMAQKHARPFLRFGILLLAALSIVATLAVASRNAAAQMTAITCGQTLLGEISVLEETDTFTFTAQAGEVVSITTAEVTDPSGSFQPTWQLFAPDGHQVGFTCFGQCESEPLPANGTYTIKVFDSSDNATGFCNLNLNFLTSVCAVLATETIFCKASGCRPSITCQLAEEDGIPCSNPIDVFTLVPRRSGTASADPAAKTPRRVRFAFGIANVPPGGTETERLRLTRAGKKIVRTSKKRRLNGVFEIRNTPGNLIDGTRVRIRLR